MKARYAGARQAGTTEEKIAALEDPQSPPLSARERAAVLFAEKMAVDHRNIDAAQWTELRRHFSEAEIIELATHATLYIGFGRLNEIIGL